MAGNIAHVTRARAPYLRALQEAFADELGAAGSLAILWPGSEGSDFPDAAAIPERPNIRTAFLPPGPRLAGDRRLPSPELWNALKKSRPDLIWVHEFSPFTLGGLLYAKRERIPVVVSTEVGRANAHFFPASVRFWHGCWGHLADGIIANCPAARVPLSGEPRPTIDAFHAVDSRRFVAGNGESRHVADGLTRFAFVGHMIPRKGIDLLLNAAVELRCRGRDDFRLRLIGKDAAGWGKAEVARRGLEGLVEMPGFLSGDELRNAICSADVFVLPTRRDTYAAVVHEAACLGMPLLVSRHAGACEALVRDGQTGFAFTPEDCAEFADAMQRLLTPTVRLPMRAASRAAGDAISAHRRAAALRGWMKQHFRV